MRRFILLYGFGAWPHRMHGTDYIITFGFGWLVQGRLTGLAYMKKVKP